MNYTYSVDVIKKATGEIVKHSDVFGIGKAHKVSDGLKINLNHDMYYVKVTRQD